MEQLIREAVRESRCDLVIASQLSMAAYNRAFRGLPAIFDEVELGFYRIDEESTLGRSARQWLTWTKHRQFLSRLLDSFRACTVVSDAERELLARAVPQYAAVHVVPNPVSAGTSQMAAGDRLRGSLIFAGSLRYGPNYDAMEWFLREVFPSVRAMVPDAKLTITGELGSAPPSSGSGVIFTGRVPDVRPLVAASAVSVAPIRVGGGTRLKILEAMAVGTPVVATTKAIEGLEVRNGEHLLVADTAHQFADAVIHVLEHPATVEALTERARGVVQRRYDSAVVVPSFLQLVERTVAL
jgi:glycosyltransferase involved in cell wall biosynthesis